MNGIAEKTDHEVVALTSEPELLSSDIHRSVRVSISNPFSTLWKVKKHFSDCDVVHVPINIYQVGFVRLGFRGPIVGGIGPGLQHGPWHIWLAKHTLAVKIRTHERQDAWVKAGIRNEMCIATINTEIFKEYSNPKTKAVYERLNVNRDNDILLYIGTLNEEKGAKIIDELATKYGSNSTTILVGGDGPLRERVEANDNIRYEGFIRNKDLSDYYNIADITLGPRISDVTSNVGLESIACGTPYISTADGPFEIFSEEPPYIRAERSVEAIWKTIQRYMNNESLYQKQVKQGFNTLEYYPVTLESAIDIHSQVYESLRN